jgi:hypothetical protein
VFNKASRVSELIEFFMPTASRVVSNRAARQLSFSVQVLFGSTTVPKEITKPRRSFRPCSASALFGQVIAMFKDLKTFDVFAPIPPAVDVFKREQDRNVASYD